MWAGIRIVVAIIGFIGKIFVTWYEEHLKKKEYPKKNRDNSENDFIFDVIKTGNIEAVQLWIAKGLDVNIRNKEGNTLLIDAVQRRYLKIALVLLEAEANVHFTDKGNLTALWWAENTRDGTEMVKLLKIWI